MPEVPFLTDVLIILAAAVIAAPLFERLRSSTVLGYLVAGVLIGPHGFGIVEESATTHGLAELGVAFLLFTIGLELSIDRLRVIRTYIFGLGTAQVVVTGAVIGLIAAQAGVPVEGAVVIGGALALSSTAIVLQLLSERKELPTRVGRIALAILLLQDLAVVPLLALVPSLAVGEAPVLAAVWWPIIKGIAVMVAIFAFGRLILRPLLRIIAVGRSSELFAAVTLLVVLGAAWATAQVGLSLAIGGFMAGLLLAETEYRHQVAADIAPFRGLLLGLFFMTVGMGLDVRLAIESLGLVLTLVFGMIAVKAAILSGLSLAARNPPGPSLHVGLLLAQGGEFAFIMFTLAIDADVIAPRLGSQLILAVAISMALTPLLAVSGRLVDGWLKARSASGTDFLHSETQDLRDHVIIAGYGRVGQSVAKTLAAAEIPYVALEFEPTRVSESRARGQPVFFGDASRPAVLTAVGADRARAAVVTMDDAAAAERTVHLLHQYYPGLHIFVRARDSRHRHRLEAAGATGIVHETFEMSLQLGGSVLRRLGTPDEKIQEIILDHRADDYARLSDLILPAVASADRAASRDARAGDAGKSGG